MGRKQVPEPLSLAASPAHIQAPNGPNSGRSLDSPSITPDTLISSASNPHTALGNSGYRSPRGPGFATETSLQVAGTTTAAKSPKSPRSPFSKFNTSKKPDLEPAQTTAQPKLQSKFSNSQRSPDLRFERQDGPVAATHEQDYNHYSRGSPSEQSLPRPQIPSQPQSQSQSQSRPQPPQAVFPGQGAEPQRTVTTPTLRDGAGPVQISGPPRPAHDQEEDKHSRSGSRFFNFKTSKPDQSLPREPPRESHRALDPSQSLSLRQTNSSSEAMSRGQDYSVPPDRGSSKASKHSDNSSEHQSAQKAAQSLPTRSDLSLASVTSEYDNPNSRKAKPKPFMLLSRNKSLKDKDYHNNREMSSQANIQEPERSHTFTGQQPLKTAPPDKELHDRSFRQMMNDRSRNHSADRAAPRDMTNKDNRPDRDHSQQNRSHPSSFKDGGSSGNFFSGLKNSGSRAADMFAKGLFGSKTNRTGSAPGREHVVDDENYQLKVLNLPLRDQVRQTRIAKRLELARDKTEFWMPSFAWRVIDYLNYKGCDVEGLYRVPGSGPQIKMWQRRFDEEGDLDLFEQDDLYDINIIGSMLKAWLRELPDEILPKEIQEKVARECTDSEKVPKMLIDSLSQLPPYNYYLLFAITCHLSLLLSHSDKNKMDFRNLCICFQPCMKIDALSFRFLVCNWKECWDGCKTESRYLEEEYALFEEPVPRLGQPLPTMQNLDGHQRREDRAKLDRREISRRNVGESHGQSGNGPPTLKEHPPQEHSQREERNGRPRKKTNGTNTSVTSISTGLSVDDPPEPKRSTELRPLSPIKPLSPLGF